MMLLFSSTLSTNKQAKVHVVVIFYKTSSDMVDVKAWSAWLLQTAGDDTKDDMDVDVERELDEHRAVVVVG